jgi:hypothetical protein
MQLRTIWRVSLAAMAVGACSGERAEPAPSRSKTERTPAAPSASAPPAPPAVTTPPPATAGSPAANTAAAAPDATPGAAALTAPGGEPGATAPGAAAPGAAAPAAAVDQAGAGRDFIDVGRMLYRAVACAGDEPLPAHLDAKIVTAHCKLLEERKEFYRQRYVSKAKEFIAALRPPGLPTTVVYPFGGGDLISALVAYPDAREITTISLEHGGDPRRIGDVAGIGPVELSQSLQAFRAEIGGMLEVSNNTSVNMSSAHTNLLPAQLSSFLVGLAVHGFEPVSLRYFTIAADGTLRYLDDAAILEMEREQARQLKHDWQKPNFSAAFSNVELQFRERGAAADAPVRVHRHIAANLANMHLPKDGPVLTHLAAKGRVSAMTKAASYLLWRNDFSNIRDYLLAHMDFMISDSTGIPPMFARKAGMEQIPLGRFEQSFLNAPEQHNLDFQALWAQKPFRRLPFRFGYVDAARQAHLLITRPRPPGPPDAAGAAGPDKRPRAKPKGTPL